MGSFKIESAKSVRDMGIMFTAATFEDTSLRNSKIEARAKRFKAAKRLIQVDTRVSALVPASVAPMSSYGVTAFGTTLTQRDVTMSMIASAYCSTRLRCPVLRIAATKVVHYDPLIRALVKQLKFVKFHFDWLLKQKVNPAEVLCDWMGAFKPVAGSRSKEGTQTPITGLISMLLDVGISPARFLFWEFNGTSFNSHILDTQENFEDTVTRATNSAHHALWAKAAEADDGFAHSVNQEVADVLSFSSYRRLRRKCPKRAGMLLAFKAGAIWTSERKQRKGIIQNALRRRCQLTDETLHRCLYECAANDRTPDETTQEINYLKTDKTAAEFDCLRLRSLAPLCNLPDLLPPPASAILRFSRGTLPNCSACSCTDGAGGSAGALPHTRRTVFAAVTYPMISPALPVSGPPTGGEARLMVILHSNGQGRLQMDKTPFWWGVVIFPKYPILSPMGSSARPRGRTRRPRGRNSMLSLTLCCKLFRARFM